MSSNVQVAQPRRRGPRATRKNYKPKNLNLQFKSIERGQAFRLGLELGLGLLPDELKWQSALICTVFIVLTSQYSQFP